MINNKSSFSVQEVADILEISKNTVYELIKKGDLSSYRIGRKVRIDNQDIETYKNKSRTDKRLPENVVLRGTFQLPPMSSNPSMQYSSASSRRFENFIICGQDALLDILTRYLERFPYNIQALRLYTGSYNGLVELYKGNVTIASAHLWDSETGEYNLPYIRKLLPGFSCIIVNLAYRMQGFYVAKGNPKKISEWKDLLRNDVTMLNRELGCGVRVLIDESLRKNGLSKYSINGYQNVELSHLAVASAVARGDVDVSVGNEKTALQVDNLDFVPIQKERLDLVIPKDYMYDQWFQAIIEILNSKAFHNELMGLGGYDISETGNIIAEI